MRLAIACALLASACNFPRPTENEAVAIGGEIDGLWAGAHEVALRMKADGSEVVLRTAQNGAFQFPTTLAEGTPYTVEIAESPAHHTCGVAAGAAGTTPPSDVTTIEIACTGPALAVRSTAPMPFRFDPTVDVQPVTKTSLVVQNVAFAVESPDGLIDAVEIDGKVVPLGVPSSAIDLPLGPSTIELQVRAQDGLSKLYSIVLDRGAEVAQQMAYVKASHAGGNMVQVAISGDTMVVGSTSDGSGATGVNGNELDTSKPTSGAVYVFQRNGSTWMQQAFLKASNTDTGDHFGASVALAGNTLAIGAPDESSAAVGVNGAGQSDNSKPGAGAVYVFQRSGTIWVQQAYVKPQVVTSQEAFGTSVALSGDTLVVGAVGESTSVTNSGAAYVFQRFAGTWVQQALLKAANPVEGAHLGHAVAVSGDYLAAAAPSENGASTGINGDPANQSAVDSGAVYLFARAGVEWTQNAYVKASNTRANQFFGESLALDRDTLVVGAPSESSKATGVDGDQADTSSYASGAVYVFTRAGSLWSQQSYLKASNPDSNDYFGASVAVAGNNLVVGAYQEASKATGSNGDEGDNSLPAAGAAYFFVRSGTRWSQQSYLKASNTDAHDTFGFSVAAGTDTLAVAALGEDSNATGINGNEQDNSVMFAGAVYVFR